MGVPTSTVRYYERVGLMALPARTTSGYRDYEEDEAARLLFIARARRMGLSCAQITSLIPVWAGTNCGAAHERVGRLVDEQQAETAERIAELQQFSAQLEVVRASLAAEPPLAQCRSDLTCCVPESPGGPIALELFGVGAQPQEVSAGAIGLVAAPDLLVDGTLERGDGLRAEIVVHVDEVRPRALDRLAHDGDEPRIRHERMDELRRLSCVEIQR